MQRSAGRVFQAEERVKKKKKKAGWGWGLEKRTDRHVAGAGRVKRRREGVEVRLVTNANLFQVQE